MKTSRSISTISLVLNLVLLAAAGILFSKPVRKPVERVVTKIVTNNETATEIVTSSPEQILETKTQPPFDWSMVASADLEVYVKNLRAIGCPQDTIRDIITPEVDEIFVKKLTEKLDPLRQGFWTILANWKTQEKEVEENMKGVEKLGDARNEMLKKLLGAEKKSATEYNAAEKRRQDWLNFLPEEKQDQIHALERKYNEDREKIRNEAKGKSLTAEDQKKISEFAKQLAEQRKALMTPEEFEEWQLRVGDHGHFRFNAAMPDFSAEDTRALAKAEMDFDQSHPQPKNTGATNKAETEARNAAHEQQMKSVLGDERYADYTRAKDGNFQQVYRVTERYELPRETAVKVFDLQQSATKQANELRKAKDVTDDERAELLSVLQEETQRGVTQTLGADAAKTYQRYGGGWIDGLSGE